MHIEEVVGKFWTNECVEHEVYGLLKVDGDNRVTLYLYDWPIPPSSSNQDLNYRFSHKTIPSIFGELENGKSVVLRNLRYSGFRSHGLERFTFSVEFVSYGSYETAENSLHLKYNSANFKFTSINLIIGESVITTKLFNEGKNDHQISTKDPVRIPFQLEDGTTLYINHSYNLRQERFTNLAEDSTFIELYFTEYIDDTSILNDYLKPFMLFISYLAGDYLAISDLNLIRDNPVSHTEYFPTVYGLISKPPENVDDLPVNLRGMMKEDFGAIFSKFCTIHHSNPLMFNLIVLQTQRSSIVLEYKYITLVGVLDSLVYDLKGSKRYIPKCDYAEKVVKPLEEYLKSIDIIESNPGLFDRVMEQIRNANTKNFKPMLEVSIENHKTILPEQVVLQKDTMISKIIRYRADYVHFRKIKASQDADFLIELYNTYRYVYCLVDAIIYSKIGISDSYAKHHIESKHQLLITYLSKL